MREIPEIVRIMRSEELEKSGLPFEKDLIDEIQNQNESNIRSKNLLQETFEKSIMTDPKHNTFQLIERQLETVFGLKQTSSNEEYHTQLKNENEIQKPMSFQSSGHEIQYDTLEKTDKSVIKNDGHQAGLFQNATNILERKNNTNCLNQQHKETIDRKTGFGWKGLGSRTIRYHDDFNQYFYEVCEPELSDQDEKIKDEICEVFRSSVNIDVFDLDTESKYKKLEETLDKIIMKKGIILDPSSKDAVYYYIFQEFLGYGLIDILMNDTRIEDISCDGPYIPLFIYHGTYESIRTNIIFDSENELDSFVVKLAQMSGKQISVFEPAADGKLPDGSRLSVTLSHAITQGSTFTIRKFREEPFTPIDLIENNTISLEMAAYFWMVVEYGASILFCGGTAAGKTTILNALALFLPSYYKIFTIEDTREVNLAHENWVAGTTRTGFSNDSIKKTGKDVDMFDLIRIALRQRPNVVIVGEVRGKEAGALFQAMSTGHISYSTIHAEDIHSLIQRLENPPLSVPRTMITSLDLIVFIKNVMFDGKNNRRVMHVHEIIKMDAKTNRLVFSTPFRWDCGNRFFSDRKQRSLLIDRIKKLNGWSDEKISFEIEQRKKILDWMMRKEIRSLKDVGKVFSQYHVNPDEIFQMMSGGDQ